MIVLACYPHMPTRELARKLKRKIQSVYRIAAMLGVSKSTEYLKAKKAEERRRLSEAGVAYRFKKGIVPANKGTRRPGWAAGRMKETQFKKGQRSVNWMPIGAEREAYGYLLRKMADVPNVPYYVNWKPVHVLVWEAKNGQVPPGHKLRFKDGNRRNFELDNLEPVSHAENLRRNSIHRYPPELKDVIRLQTRLIREIGRRAA